MCSMNLTLAGLPVSPSYDDSLPWSLQFMHIILYPTPSVEQGVLKVGLFPGSDTHVFLQIGQRESLQSAVGKGFALTSKFLTLTPPCSINLILRLGSAKTLSALVLNIFNRTPPGVGGTNITALYLSPIFHQEYFWLFFFSLSAKINSLGLKSGLMPFSSLSH